MVFTAYSIVEPKPEHRLEVKEKLLSGATRAGLVLDTCQRLEFFGFSQPDDTPENVDRTFHEKEAFEHLCRIAAGLESRILGELEVLGQVRNAYKEFKTVHGENAGALDTIFQEALTVARKARKKSGIDTQLTSLSGLTARTVLDRIHPGEPIAVVGSGVLASSVVRYLFKRGKSPLRVSSRCPEKAMTLAMEAGGFGVGLDELSCLLKDVHAVITATAAPHPVLYAHHLEQAHKNVVVADLGVPADCSFCAQQHDYVDYISLEEIEQKALVNVQDRERRSLQAAEIIRQEADAWCPRS